MYIKLIDQILRKHLEISWSIYFTLILDDDYDKEFLEEMLKDPDFYGLTYDSYKILNFKFDN